MLNLITTTDKLEIESSVAGTLDCYAAIADTTGGASPVVQDYNRVSLTHSAASITDFVTAPGGTLRRNVKTIHVENAHASLTTDVTIYFNVSGTRRRLRKYSLKPGEGFEYVEGVGWYPLLAAVPKVADDAATLTQIAAHSADTYYLGLPINGKLQAGTWFRWTWMSTKGAAGVATPTYIIRFGTAGAVGDTARVTLTGPVQTGAADTGYFIVEAVVRVHGASGVIHARCYLSHTLATTGFANVNPVFIQGTSATFDTTVAGSIVGLSVNPGASGAWVTEAVLLHAENLVAA